MPAPNQNERGTALSLLSAEAVRERAHEMLLAGMAGELECFTVHQERLGETADFVADVIRENYPRLDVPLHARWRHFVFDGRDLWAEIAGRARWQDRAARARAEFDLAIVSVLLDAGAGPDWRYKDETTGIVAGRSEGLALASLRMFEAGMFSANPAEPLRADAAALAAMTAERLAAGFQATGDNPLAGLDGRAALLSRLGRAIGESANVFARENAARPGGLFDHLAANKMQDGVAAPDILHSLLVHLGPIWPGRINLGSLSLGDTWRHPAIRRADATNGLIPFHKLSQWLTYSLIEPLQGAGIAVPGIDSLTGLAEYRNGGLFVDSGVIALRDAGLASKPSAVDSALVVEWRALTIALLDLIAPLVRGRLGVSEAKFPLGCVLEGGTWAAGRRIAQQKRPDGGPPVAVVSDGTVF